MKHCTVNTIRKSKYKFKGQSSENTKTTVLPSLHKASLEGKQKSLFDMIYSNSVNHLEVIKQSRFPLTGKIME